MENKTVKYITKYQKENTVQINVRLSKKYDPDLITWMDGIEENLDIGKATYIKRLIREDMARRQQKV